MPFGDRIGAIAGRFIDFVRVPYVFGENSVMAHLNTMYYHVHGRSFVYPDLADDVLLTSGTGAWSTAGAMTEVIPSGALTVSAFDLHWIEISNISDVSTVQIDIYAGDPGSEVWIGATRANRSTAQSRNGQNAIQIPQQPPGTRINCRLSDSTAGSVTCIVSFEGHYYSS